MIITIIALMREGVREKCICSLLNLSLNLHCTGDSAGCAGVDSERRICLRENIVFERQFLS